MNKESGGSTSLISRIHNSIPDGIYIATSLSSIKTTEFELVQGLLHVLQGNSSQFFVWDEICGRYYAKVGIFVTHLSQTGLHEVLNQFLYAASCLRLTDVVIRKIETDGKGLPTLRAFANSASAWLERLRDIALKEEVKINEFNPRTVPTLLGLANSLSSLCSGAESLSQIVHEAVPKLWLEFINSVPAAEVAVHILDFLYKKLNEACLVQGGEEEVYRMLLYLFVGSLLPYIASLDSWIHEGILDDPCSELFFYENKSVSISDTEFWEKSYLLRSLTLQKFDGEHSGAAFQQQACPLFLKDIAKEIVSAGKSLQLIRHVPMTLYSSRSTGPGCENIDGVRSNCAATVAGEVNSGYSAEGLTLVEVFFLSVAGVIGYGDHVYNYFLKDDFSSLLSCILGSESERQQSEARDWRNSSSTLTTAKKTWVEFLHDILLERQSCRKLKMSSSLGKSESAEINLQDEFSSTIPSLSGSEVEGHEFEVRDVEVSSAAKVIPRKIGLELLGTIIHERQSSKVEKSSSRRKGESAKARLASVESFCPENPVTTVCQKLLKDNKAALQTLNLSNDSILPPLNDENLWEAIFNVEKNVPFPTKRTNSAFGFQFSESQHQRSLDDRRLLETMLPFPTVLPCCQEDLQMSELLPLQKNSSLSSRILRWIQTAEPKGTRLPMMILQECLIVYIKKQVDIIGSHMLSKLLREWRLMDELEVLRAIYLLGSGDLLRHFLTVIFSKLDKGESWDDDFELNMILQESITNSADAMLLSAPDTLVVSVLKPYGLDGSDLQNAATAVSTPRKSHEGGLGINGLDVLGFTYKVSWPLELIANTEAIKKYNQVMHFLIKVKRAKFVLDKSRRWIWKGKGAVTISRKHHWLVEQKLLHFVDAFHQYVMDRVYHSAWREMCQGMTAARSLDEVIEVHEAYLLSIQRQCFVVPDKLGALIASRVNTILGLALDFYSVQQTLHSGGAVSAIKARCEMEVDRIEKQFDDCIAFLLRVLSFKLNVGHFPHLADLVTRINYNYYYMSDNGNMITAPGSESVRLPKTFPSRPG